MSAPQIDGVSHALRSQADRLFHATNLGRDRFALGQTGLSIELYDERDFSCIVFFGNALVEN